MQRARPRPCAQLIRCRRAGSEECRELQGFEAAYSLENQLLHYVNNPLFYTLQ